MLAEEVFKVTEKISLHPSKPSDAEELFNLVDKNRKYLAPWLSWVETTVSKVDTERFLISVEKQLSIMKQLVFLIRYEGNLCGTLGFHNIDITTNYSELGYWLDEDHQGKGIVSGAVNFSIPLMEKLWGIRKFVIECNVDNLKSQAVAERLGFKGVVTDKYSNNSRTLTYLREII